MVIHLSPKQKQVCELVAEGCTSKQIAMRLGLSHRTVEDHRAVVYRKMGVRSAVELVRKLLVEMDRTA